MERTVLIYYDVFSIEVLQFVLTVLRLIIVLLISGRKWQRNFVVLFKSKYFVSIASELYVSIQVHGSYLFLRLTRIGVR